MTAALPQSENAASHLGVYAFIVDRAGENLLVIKKGLGCYTGLYDLPGGTMDPLETLEETLIRETLEETCCTVTSYQQLGAFSLLYPFLKDGRGTRGRRQPGMRLGAVWRSRPSKCGATGLAGTGRLAGAA